MQECNRLLFEISSFCGICELYGVYFLDLFSLITGNTFSSWLATGSSDNYVCVSDLSSVFGMWSYHLFLHFSTMSFSRAFPCFCLVKTLSAKSNKGTVYLLNHSSTVQRMSTVRGTLEHFFFSLTVHSTTIGVPFRNTWELQGGDERN